MKRDGHTLQLDEFVNSLEDISPAEIYNRLGSLGYIGQERARRNISLSAYRHLKRIKLLQNPNTKRSELTPKPNSVLIGPTGCGKTYLLELLFGDILKIPYIIVDMTKFTESGYVGDDVVNILVQLVYSSDESIEIAEKGVVVLDEFDKIAGSYSNARFAGQGTTKDVSGYGVQRELLKIIEGTDIQIPLDFGFSSRGQRSLMSTRDISFFAVGAFSGIKNLIEKYGMGFMQLLSRAEEINSNIAYSITDEEADDISQFHLFGFLPELIARFNRIIPFEPLNRNKLKDILVLKIDKYKREFLIEGYALIIDTSVADLIVDEAIRRQTGARGLDVLITKYIEEVAFELFGKTDSGEILLKTDKNGKVTHQIRKRIKM